MHCTIAQNAYLTEANAQLRSMFSQITFPSSDVLFLYERSAKVSDSSFYQNNSLDTLDANKWKSLYYEMYYAAHDTLPLKTSEEIDSIAFSYSNDTINLAVMDYDWYYLKEHALTSNTYFNFDLSNNVLLDNPSSTTSAFNQSNIFAVSPLQKTSSFIAPTFRINPDLFFTDNINASLYSASTFRIDFGDGTGWHYFNPNIIETYTVEYPDLGDYMITTELLNDKKEPIKSSTSSISISGKSKSNTADYVIDMPGLNVGVYNSCGEDNGKIVIYLEGIDIADVLKSQNRNIDMIYGQMIHRQYIEELRNFGYSFYVIDWKNSRIDMRFNALYVVNLIEKLKKQYAYSDEQFVIIGESMGGIIARYALSYMESSAYVNGSYNNFFIEATAPSNAIYLALNPELFNLGSENRVENLVQLTHKTRELITIDSPHQGANIPIGLQLAYKQAKNTLGLILPTSSLFLNAFNQGLDSYAAKQLLLYHLDGATPISNNNAFYYPATQHDSFFGQLSELGNYPQYCKLMALSNGALNGDRQRYDNGDFRIPNDVLFNYTINKTYKIFGKQLPLYQGTLLIRTNPNGGGQVFNANFTYHQPYISLYFWGITLTTLPITIINHDKYASNVKPFCISAGGQQFFGFDLNDEEFYIEFGFIPVASALDYDNNNNPLTHNLETEDINLKLSKTPFDVIMGYTNGENNGHLNYRDEGAFNITRTNAVNCFPSNGKEYAYSDAADQGLCEIKRGLLNLEIGDEEMYIENFTLNRPATFQAQYDVRVNERNPYYEYPSLANGPLKYEGIYSKEKDFSILPVGNAKFIYNTNGASVNAVGFMYNSPQPTNLWTATEEELDICLEDFSTKQFNLQEQEVYTPNNLEESYLYLVPNPINGSTLQCKYKVNAVNTKPIIYIYDTMGNILIKKEIEAKSNIGITKLEVSTLQAGMYVVVLENTAERLTQKLIIN